MWDKALKFFNDNKDALSFLFGSGIVLVAIGGITTFIRWILKEYRLHKIRPNKDFPFKIIPPNSNVAKEILGGSDDDPLSDRNIPYQQRVEGKNIRRGIEQELESNRWVLITGRTGLGKTREAINAAQSLNNEGWTILYLTRDHWLDAPANLPEGVPERKLLFVLDDLNRKCYASKAEIRPDPEETTTLPLTEPFQNRLLRVLEVFDVFCGKSEIRVLATARNEEEPEYPGEPSEWEKLNWNKFSKLWERFQLHNLPSPSEKAIVQLLIQFAEKEELTYLKEDINIIAKRNDGTFANIVENLRRAKRRGEIILNEFTDTLQGNWMHRYQTVLKKYPEAKYIYKATLILQNNNINLFPYLIFPIALSLTKSNPITQITTRWKINNALAFLIKHENILEPRDGQLEVSGGIGNLEIYDERLVTILIQASNKWGNKMNPSIGNFGLALARRNKYNLAVKVITQGINIQGRDSWFWNTLGTIYYNWDRNKYSQDLIKAFHEAHDLDPNSEISWHGMGHAYECEGQLEKSIESFNKAIEINPQNTANWFCLGKLFVSESKYSEAINALQNLLALDPTDSGSRETLSALLSHENRYDEALSLWQLVIQNDPLDAVAWERIGLINYYDLSNDREAIRSFKKAIRLNPNNGDYWINIGIVYGNKKDLKNSMNAFRKANELSGNNADALEKLGNALYSFKMYPDAIRSYEKSLDLNPNNTNALDKLGELYILNNRNNDAFEALRKAVELDPKNINARNRLSNVLENENQIDVACNILKKIIGNNPQDDHAWRSLGVIYNNKLHKKSEAIEAFKKAIELNSNDPLSWYNIGVIYETEDKLDDAVFSLQKAAELNPNDADIWNNLGRIYLNQKKGADAIFSLDKSISLEPVSDTSWHLLGHAYESVKDIKKAMRAFNKAIKLNPSDLSHLYCLGQIYINQGKKKQALNIFLKRSQLDSKVSSTWFNLGIIYGDLKQYDKAIEAYRNAIKLESESKLASPAHNNLADIYIRKGLFKEAEHELFERIKLNPDNTFAPTISLGIISYLQGQLDASDYFRDALNQWDNAWKDKLQSAYTLLEGKAIALLCLGNEDEAFSCITMAFSELLPIDDIDLTIFKLIQSSSQQPHGIRKMIKFINQEKRKQIINSKNQTKGEDFLLHKEI